MISQGSSSQPIFGTAVVAGGGTGATSFNTTGVVISGATTTTALASVTLTDGQLAIGSSIGNPAAATLSAGTGISITNGNNSITIAVSGSAVLETLTGNSGGAISPSAGNINTLGTGSITIAGSGSTLTTQLTGLTNHNVLVGAGSTTITKVAPSATSGVPLISQGASSDPTFGTAVVAGGGTGNATQDAYSIVCGGTTTTGAFQAVDPVASGSVLTSAGTTSLPAWAASTSVGNWVFVEQHNVSGAASANFTNAAIGSTTYKSFVIMCSNVLVGTNNDDVYLQVSLDGGSTYKTSGYHSGINYTTLSSATWTNVNQTTGCYINTNCNGLNSFSSHFYLTNVQAQLLGYFTCSGTIGGQVNNVQGLALVGGYYNSANVKVNAFRIIAQSGNISGNFTLYGIPG